MTMWKRNALMPVFVAALLGVAKAQENAPEQPQATEAGAPAAQAAPTVPPAPPPPGPEVMHPTTHGLRLTPALARGFSQAMAWGGREELKTTPEQQQQLADRWARRLMEMGRKHQRDVQPALEHLFATLIEQEGNGQPGLKLTPEAAREAGQRWAPLVPVMREAMDALEKDADSILNPEQKEAMRKKMQDGRDGAKHLEEVLARWAQGDYREGDNPFDNPKKPSQAAGDGSGDKEGATPKPTKPEMRNAEAVARMNLEQLGPADWSRLLDAVKKAFEFDDQQRAKADQLLADYRGKAEAIMTPEWKQAVRTNRIKSHLNNWLRGQPNRPFFFHLQQEYASLTKPLNELGLAFRADLLAIATPEQRGAAIAEVESTAADLGLTLAPMDETVLGLAATQPTAGAP